MRVTIIASALAFIFTYSEVFIDNCNLTGFVLDLRKWQGAGCLPEFVFQKEVRIKEYDNIS